MDAGPLMIPEAAVRVGDERVEASLELVVAELAGDSCNARSAGAIARVGFHAAPAAVGFDEQPLGLGPTRGVGELSERPAGFLGPGEDDERTSLAEHRSVQRRLGPRPRPPCAL